MNAKSVYISLIILGSLYTDTHTADQQKEDLWFLTSCQQVKVAQTDYITFQSGSMPLECSRRAANRMSRERLQA